MNFSQLHLHTSFSILDGVPNPEDYVEKAVSVGMKSLAITDHGTMSGVYRFSKSCLENNIKPIIGCEFYVNNNRDNDKGKEKGSNNHIVLLAKNEGGYKNLLKINYDSFYNGYYYKGRTTEDFIWNHNKGVICTTACMQSSISQLLLQGKLKESERRFLQYKEAYYPDFYGELQFNEVEQQKDVTQWIYDLCKKHKVKFIVTGDCHYIEKSGANIQDYLLMVNQRKSESDDNIFRFSARHLYFHSMFDYFQLNKKFDFPFREKIIEEGCANTEEIAEKCDFSLSSGGDHKFPKYLDEDGETLDSYKVLKEKCMKGLINKFPSPYDSQKKNTYKGRMEIELEVVKEKGFSDYFLIIDDIINFCKKNKIGIGAGRGSVAGSLISYLLGITKIDPLRFGLLFERFLNKERKDPPDIDIDFESDRKPEIEDYLKKKYGEERVAHIITFSTFGTKGALRDIARVMEKEKDIEFLSIVNKINDDTRRDKKILGQLSEITFTSKEKEYIEKNKKLFEIADSLVGKIKNPGQHAAGTAITPGPIYQYIPVQKLRGNILTGFTEGKDWRELSDLGILKIDLLGLDQVDIIKSTLERIEKYEKKKVDIDNIDLNDKKLFKALNSHPCVGIFQFENQGIDAYLKQVEPFCFEDIVSVNALYRPAIMNAHEHEKYLERRRNILNGQKLKYHHEGLRDILDPTYGTIIYQEQFIQILNKIGKFSLVDADKARKTFKLLYLINQTTEKKKDSPELKEVVGKFKKGALENDYPENRIEGLIQKLAEFAEYSFNRSHSVSYSVISMQTLFLREYYPLYFYSSLLDRQKNTEQEKGYRKENKMRKYINYAKSRGVEFLPFDIQNMVRKFTPEGGKIRIPITILKGVGDSLIDEIEKAGPFSSSSDFFVKELKFKSNRTSVLNMIDVGVFDSLNSNRRALHSFYEEWASKKSKYRAKEYNEMKKGMRELWDKYKDYKEYKEEELRDLEKEIIGFNIFRGDGDEVDRKIRSLIGRSKIIKFRDNLDLTDNQRYCFRILGSLKTTRKSTGEVLKNDYGEYCFLTAEDWEGDSIEVSVPAWEYKKYKTTLKEMENSKGYLLMVGYRWNGMLSAGMKDRNGEPRKTFIKLEDLKNL